MCTSNGEPFARLSDCFTSFDDILFIVKSALLLLVVSLCTTFFRKEALSLAP
jgi:hypothetical protein